MVMSVTMYALFEFTIFLLIRSDRRKAERLARTTSG
jgi:hypothetical protein